MTHSNDTNSADATGVPSPAAAEGEAKSLDSSAVEDAPVAGSPATAAPEPEESGQSDARVESDGTTSESEAVTEAVADAAAEGEPGKDSGAAAASSQDPEPAADATEEPEATASSEADDDSDVSKAPPELVDAWKTGRTLEGKVIGWNKGGFHVSLDGVPAFCPKSQIELGNPRKSASYLDRTLDFRILELKDGGRRVIVSRSALLLENREERLKEIADKQASGELLKGRISSITDFGAFVDIGGLEGLVHLSEISRRRFEHPSELLEVGQEIEVKVIKVERGGKRISLSAKATEPDPWQGLEERLPTGEKAEGKILRKTDFGMFVEVEPGVEGLVHLSQLPHGAKLDDPSYEPGSVLETWVREVDGKRKRLSLSLRPVATTDPWKDLVDRYPEGTETEGTIEQVAKFGLFVELEPGLTGLLPFSQMSQEGPVRQRHTAGQRLRVQVASIDRSRRRLSLAPVGSRLEGTKADFRDYQKKQKSGGEGLNAMAAAFAKLEGR